MRTVRLLRPVRGSALGLLLAAGLSLSSLPAPASQLFAWRSAVAPAIPARLTDAEFWKLVSDISEPGGYFRITDNFTSNEREIGTLFTMLRDAGIQGGVYLGVGPEQNLTYIAAIRPVTAFVCDIRRQAVMQHLMFKSVFELSADRADFISLLFSKPRPAGLDASTPIQKMWEAFLAVATDTAAAAKNRTRIVERLTKTHGFTFTAEESGQLDSVLDAFVAYGPSISTRGGSSGPGGFGGRGGGGSGGTFAELTGWSTDVRGQPQSFLSTEDNYRYVKTLQDKNLVVPVSGDFGGPKAIRAIGAWLKGQGATVSAFYVSNVEQYLFQDGKDRAFYDNVAALPTTATTVFIRPYSMRRGMMGPTQSLCPIAGFIRSVTAGQVISYNDALACR